MRGGAEVVDLSPFWRQSARPVLPMPSSGRQLELATALATRLEVRAELLLVALADMGVVIADCPLAGGVL